MKFYTRKTANPGIASRKGGARLEKEVIDGFTVVHNYGAGGAGYQSSWGMAKDAVELLADRSRL